MTIMPWLEGRTEDGTTLYVELDPYLLSNRPKNTIRVNNLPVSLDDIQRQRDGGTTDFILRNLEDGNRRSYRVHVPSGFAKAGTPVTIDGKELALATCTLAEYLKPKHDSPTPVESHETGQIGKLVSEQELKSDPERQKAEAASEQALSSFSTGQVNQVPGDEHFSHEAVHINHVDGFHKGAHVVPYCTMCLLERHIMGDHGLRPHTRCNLCNQSNTIKELMREKVELAKEVNDLRQPKPEDVREGSMTVPADPEYQELIQSRRNWSEIAKATASAMSYMLGALEAFRPGDTATERASELHDQTIKMVADQNDEDAERERKS